MTALGWIWVISLPQVSRVLIIPQSLGCGWLVSSGGQACEEVSAVIYFKMVCFPLPLPEA